MLLLGCNVSLMTANVVMANYSLMNYHNYFRRVEGFDMVEGFLIDYQNTFHLPLTTCFWLETAWYCIMLTEQLVTIVVFTRNHNSNEIIKSIVGLMIVSTCFALLMVAETKRCCVQDDSEEVSRLLAASGSTGEEYNDYAVEGADTTECTCGSFGSRVYGGLGTIEPFTFLMALYPLRTLVNRPIARLLGLNSSTEVTHKSNEPHDNHHGPGPEVARNIWLSTIGSHADVAKTHGLFSVQVLYCMLGLDTPEQKSLHTQSAHENNSIPQESITNDKASEISGNQDDTVLINSLGVDFDDEEFIFPDSKLIRRMRRCERKMLPLLDTWMLVDVALT